MLAAAFKFALMMLALSAIVLVVLGSLYALQYFYLRRTRAQVAN